MSLFAALRGQTQAALGNIVGSNFVTLTFVAGVCALWRPIVAGPSLRQRESSWMILAAALLLVLAMDGRLSRTDGCLLIVAGVLLQMFITSGRRFVRLEAAAMMAVYALFLAAQFAGFRLALP